jgi:hypothetical protein
MSSMDEYVGRADPAKAERLCRQWGEAISSGEITCLCGWKRSLVMAYRCLYCGEWFCAPCAEKHFGQTILDWVKQKRRERRAELEAKHGQ